MDIQLLKEKVKRHIAKDELTQALELLLKHFEKNEIYLQSGRYNKLVKDIRKGLITDENEDVKLNKLRLALLELVDELEKEETKDSDKPFIILLKRLIDKLSRRKKKIFFWTGLTYFIIDNKEKVIAGLFAIVLIFLGVRFVYESGDIAVQSNESLCEFDANISVGIFYSVGTSIPKSEADEMVRFLSNLVPNFIINSPQQVQRQAGDFYRFSYYTSNNKVDRCFSEIILNDNEIKNNYPLHLKKKRNTPINPINDIEIVFSE